MILIIFQALILGAITLLSGYGLLGFLRYFFKIKKTDPYLCFSPAVAFNFGLIPLALNFAFLGLVNYLNLESFIAVILIFGVVGCYLYGLQLLLKNFSIKIYTPDVTSFLKILILLPVIIYGIGISLLPTSNWDAISYVLSFPKTHISEGSIRYLNEYGIFSSFPIYGEAIVGLPLLIFNNEQVTQVYIFIFFINILFVIKQIFRCFTESILYLFLAQISIAYLPIILVNIGIAKVEIPQAAIFLTSLLMLIIGDSNQRRILKFLAMLLFVFGIGVKYTTIFYLPIFLLLYFATEQNKSAKQFFMDIARFSLLGVAINIFWIYENISEHCNPLFPNLINYFGSCKYSIEIMTNVMTMVNESTFLQKETSFAATNSIQGYLPFFIESAGLINTVLIIIAIFTVFFFRSKRDIPLNLMYLFYGIAASFSIHIFLLLWEFRYFLAVLTLTIVIIFITFSCFKSRFLGWAISLMVFLQIYFSMSSFHARNSYIFSPLTNQISIEQYKESWIHLYWVANYINQNTAEDSVIAFNWGVQPFFYLNRKYFFLHDWNPEGSTQEMTNSSEFLNLLLQKKCNYLVWRNQDETRFKDPSLTKQYHLRMNNFLTDLVRSGKLLPLFTKDDVTIYSVLK